VCHPVAVLQPKEVWSLRKQLSCADLSTCVVRASASVSPEHCSVRGRFLQLCARWSSGRLSAKA
jgi:hypothetical protein